MLEPPDNADLPEIRCDRCRRVVMLTIRQKDGRHWCTACDYQHNPAAPAAKEEG